MIKLTQKELEAVKYHLEFDFSNIEDGYGWKAFKNDIGLEEKISYGALDKINKMLNEIKK